MTRQQILRFFDRLAIWDDEELMILFTRDVPDIDEPLFREVYREWMQTKQAQDIRKDSENLS